MQNLQEGALVTIARDQQSMPELPQELWLYAISYMPLATLIQLARTNKNLAQWVGQILQNPFELLSFKFAPFMTQDAYHAWKKNWQQEYPKHVPAQTLALTHEQVSTKKELFKFLFALHPATIVDLYRSNYPYADPHELNLGYSSARRMFFQQLRTYGELLPQALLQDIYTTGTAILKSIETYSLPSFAGTVTHAYSKNPTGAARIVSLWNPLYGPQYAMDFSVFNKLDPLEPVPRDDQAQRLSSIQHWERLILAFACQQSAEVILELLTHYQMNPFDLKDLYCFIQLNIGTVPNEHFEHPKQYSIFNLALLYSNPETLASLYRQLKDHPNAPANLLEQLYGTGSEAPASRRLLHLLPHAPIAQIKALTIEIRIDLDNAKNFKQSAACLLFEALLIHGVPPTLQVASDNSTEQTRFKQNYEQASIKGLILFDWLLDQQEPQRALQLIQAHPIADGIATAELASTEAYLIKAINKNYADIAIALIKQRLFMSNRKAGATAVPAQISLEYIIQHCDYALFSFCIQLTQFNSKLDAAQLDQLIHCAITYKKEEIFRYLLEQKRHQLNDSLAFSAYVNQVMLPKIGTHGHAGSVQLGLNYVNEATDQQQRLQLALLTANIDAIATLITHGANIQHCDSDGNNYLHIVLRHIAQQPDTAATRGELKPIVQLLIEIHQVSMTARNNKGQTPLYNAALTQDASIVQAFIDKNVALFELDNEGNSLFHLYHKLPSTLTAIHQGTLNRLYATPNAAGQLPIHCAAAYGEWVSVAFYAKRNAINVAQPDQAGNLALHHAAMFFIPDEQANTVSLYPWEELVPAQTKTQQHHPINTVNRANQTALICAALVNRSHFIQALFSSPQADDVDVGLMDAHGNTALHYAVQHRNVAVIKLLLAKGADIHAVNSHTLQTPLSLAVAISDLSILDLLNPFKAHPITLEYLKKQTECIARTLWPFWETQATKFNAFHHTQHLHDLNKFTKDTCTILDDYFQHCATKNPTEAEQTNSTPVFVPPTLAQYQQDFTDSLANDPVAPSLLLRVHGKAAGIAMLTASAAVASIGTIAFLLLGTLIDIFIFVALIQPSLYTSTPLLGLANAIFAFLSNGGEALQTLLFASIGVMLGTVATIVISLVLMTLVVMEVLPKLWNIVNRWFFNHYGTPAAEAFVEFATEFNLNNTNTAASEHEQTALPVDAVTYDLNQDSGHSLADALPETLTTANRATLNLFPRQPGKQIDSSSIAATSTTTDNLASTDELDLDQLDDLGSTTNIISSTPYAGAGAF